jgi:hypothetical protein
MRKYLIMIVASGWTLMGYAQFGSGHLAVTRMQKGKWKSAGESLRKALHKDSSNCEAEFLFAAFFLAPANPQNNLDSAYHYALTALRDFSATSPREREKLKRFSIDSLHLLRQREKIDSLAFADARRVNTEKAYVDFLEKFVFAVERPFAVELRDELAFVDALKLNTPASFGEYLRKYPASPRAEEAKRRLDKLVFSQATRDGSLTAFETFYAGFPTNLFRAEAEKNIFEIRTASGRPAAISDFLMRYPASRFAKQARDVLYHLLKEDETESPAFTDSLTTIQQLEKGYWVPVLRNGKFGFIDRFGTETIPPRFDSIRKEYTCGNLRTDYFVVSGGIVSRTGRWILKGTVGEVQDMGSGFLKVSRTNCVRVLHKSGWQRECEENVRLILKNFIAFQDKSQWGIQSLMGRQLLPAEWDDIQSVDTLVLLVKNGKKTLVTIGQVVDAGDGRRLSSALVFDDVRRLAKGAYLVRNGPLEGVLDERLSFVVPLDRQSVTKAPSGFILERNKKYRLATVTPWLDQREFDQVLFYGRWIRVQENGNLLLFDVVSKTPVGNGFDSLKFTNDMAFGFRHDSLKVYLGNGHYIGFPSDTKVNFIKSADSTRYFLVHEKNRKAVFNARTGERLFSLDADDLEYLGSAVFLTTKGLKKGLLSRAGKPLLPAEYAAIVPYEKGWVSLLREKKFGMYNLTTEKLIKPAYDRNVIPFSPALLVAYKDSGYGFIGADAKPLSGFDFAEVQPWNDSSFLVRRDFQWMIYGIAGRKALYSNIKDYRLVQDIPREKIAVVHRENQYGVISSVRGELIPANFNDIINIGSPEEPLYFCEKNVEEAGVHIVLYYDKKGVLLRKQVYESEEEYEKIYCDGN